jgi:hypothetical protein
VGAAQTTIRRLCSCSSPLHAPLTTCLTSTTSLRPWLRLPAFYDQSLRFLEHFDIFRVCLCGCLTESLGVFLHRLLYGPRYHLLLSSSELLLRFVERSSLLDHLRLGTKYFLCSFDLLSSYDPEEAPITNQSWLRALVENLLGTLDSDTTLLSTLPPWGFRSLFWTRSPSLSRKPI